MTLPPTFWRSPSGDYAFIAQIMLVLQIVLSHHQTRGDAGRALGRMTAQRLLERQPIHAMTETNQRMAHVDQLFQLNLKQLSLWISVFPRRTELSGLVQEVHRANAKQCTASGINCSFALVSLGYNNDSQDHRAGRRVACRQPRPRASAGRLRWRAAPFEAGRAARQRSARASAASPSSCRHRRPTRKARAGKWRFRMACSQSRRCSAS